MRMTLIAVVAVLAVLVVAFGVFWYTAMVGPDLSAYEKFRQATLLEMPAQQVLVVEATGKPESTGAKAFGALFGTYYKLDGVPKGHDMPAPRARWPQGLSVPTEQWVGVYALPLPAAMQQLAPQAAVDGLTPRLDTWTYGMVAQILHVGPYDRETPTIEKLHAFIEGQGYEITGAHEEEYLRGPTMFGRGDPNKYYTLIRYPVRPHRSVP